MAGSPRREFLYSADLADAVVMLMKKYTPAEIDEIINVGTGEDITISDLARKIANIVGYKGEMVFDKTKPDGIPRKLLDVSRVQSLGWRSKTGLDEGVANTYQNFLKSQ